MNGKPRILSPGERFRRLTVLEEVVHNGVKSARCRCDCGLVKVVAKCNLVSGHSGSCGSGGCKRANMAETAKAKGAKGGWKMTDRDCTHGQPARSCNICALEQEIASQAQTIAMLQELIEQPASVPDADLVRAAKHIVDLTEQRDKLLAALELLLERMELPPDRNCSCHISPPCNDCVDYSGIREAIKYTEKVQQK